MLQRLGRLQQLLQLGCWHAMLLVQELASMLQRLGRRQVLLPRKLLACTAAW